MITWGGGGGGLEVLLCVLFLVQFKFEDNKYRTYMYKKEALQPFECGLKLVSFCKDTVIEPSLM